MTIEGVPILRTGTYELSTGTRTFAEEDLRAAAAALAEDPAVKAPRIRLASLEGALNLDPTEHGGEPAFGWADGLRVSDNGQELLADLHVPDWLEPMMEWAYPSLSIEGTPPGWESATGRTHELVVTAVALLGIHWPGVTTLDDFREVLANGPELADQEDAMVLAAMPQRARPVAASLDQDLVARRFYDGLDSGDLSLPDGVVAYNIWIRSMRFDDGGRPYLKVTDEESGTLYRVDFEVAGSEVTFGEFVEVVEQDVPVAAAAGRPAPPLATWGTREQSRAVMASTQEEAQSMTDEQRRNLARALGLPEDTTEARLNEVAAERAAETPPPAEGEPETAPPPPGEGQPDGAPAVPEAVAASVPPGMMLVDEATLADLQAGAQAGVTANQRLQEEDRDRVIAAAMGEGRFPPARREHYVTAWARDPEGTRVLLTAAPEEGGLAPGLVPVQARGVEPTGESSQSEAADHDAYMQRHFPQAAAARQARVDGVRVRTEV